MERLITHEFALMKKKAFCLAMLLLLIPIDLLADTVDFIDVKKHAKLANVVYGKRIDVEDYIEAQKGKLLRYYTIPETQVAYVLWRDLNSGHQVIAIRGTANLENVIND
jgi:hypothetical protein